MKLLKMLESKAQVLRSFLAHFLVPLSYPHVIAAPSRGSFKLFEIKM